MTTATKREMRNKPRQIRRAAALARFYVKPMMKAATDSNNLEYQLYLQRKEQERQTLQHCLINF